MAMFGFWISMTNECMYIFTHSQHCNEILQKHHQAKSIAFPLTNSSIPKHISRVHISYFIIILFVFLNEIHTSRISVFCITADRVRANSAMGNLIAAPFPHCPLSMETVLMIWCVHKCAQDVTLRVTTKKTRGDWPTDHSRIFYIWISKPFSVCTVYIYIYKWITCCFIYRVQWTQR